MNVEIEVGEAFRKVAKGLAKKHPSFKKDLTEFLRNLAVNPISGIYNFPFIQQSPYTTLRETLVSTECLFLAA